MTWKRMTKQRKARLHNAAVLLKQRQERVVNPDGAFDEKGAWYPSDAERQPCCEGLASPTRRYPYSLVVHCRTAKHVAHLCDVPVDRLRETANKLPELPSVGYLPVTLSLEGRNTMHPHDVFVSCADVNRRYGLETPRALKGETLYDSARCANRSRACHAPNAPPQMRGALLREHGLLSGRRGNHAR